MSDVATIWNLVQKKRLELREISKIIVGQDDVVRSDTIKYFQADTPCLLVYQGIG
jgi:hypothetical protein